MFKKKEKTEKAPKNKKVRTMKVGTHKKSVLLLWAVLLASTYYQSRKLDRVPKEAVEELLGITLSDTND